MTNEVKFLRDALTEIEVERTNPKEGRWVVDGERISTARTGMPSIMVVASV